jgi:hypothetical protein
MLRYGPLELALPSTAIVLSLFGCRKVSRILAVLGRFGSGPRLREAKLSNGPAARLNLRNVERGH